MSDDETIIAHSKDVSGRVADWYPQCFLIFSIHPVINVVFPKRPADVQEGQNLLLLVVTLTHTSIVTHLSTTSNQIVKLGLTKLKICRHTNSIYYYRLGFFF